ncbi:MAG: MmcQ/YjbR family DNA-binding protein [Myxococcaceae bacterium]|nr:MmcQ/YjbR family DNA-binding protein [Myxococcaceae bacterium]
MDRLKAICRALPGAVEEPAWVGVRWRVGKKTFAHVLPVKGGKPAAYAKAAGVDDGVVLTFRSEVALKRPFFRAVWGTTWGPQVYGVVLGAKPDWKRLRALIAVSHRLMGGAG